MWVNTWPTQLLLFNLPHRVNEILTHSKCPNQYPTSCKAHKLFLLPQQCLLDGSPNSHRLSNLRAMWLDQQQAQQPNFVETSEKLNEFQYLKIIPTTFLHHLVPMYTLHHAQDKPLQLTPIEWLIIWSALKYSGIAFRPIDRNQCYIRYRSLVLHSPLIVIGANIYVCTPFSIIVFANFRCKTKPDLIQF